MKNKEKKLIAFFILFLYTTQRLGLAGGRDFEKKHKRSIFK
jgi:hypothetical protein